jgi:hypothetical protein
MYMMYVDESGDCGLVNSPTRFFVLTGLVLHELRWRDYPEQLIAFRRRIRHQFGLRLREELHAATRGALFACRKRKRGLASPEESYYSDEPRFRFQHYCITNLGNCQTGFDVDVRAYQAGVQGPVRHRKITPL